MSFDYGRRTFPVYKISCSPNNASDSWHHCPSQCHQSERLSRLPATLVILLNFRNSLAFALAENKFCSSALDYWDSSPDLGKRFLVSGNRLKYLCSSLTTSMSFCTTLLKVLKLSNSQHVEMTVEPCGIHMGYLAWCLACDMYSANIYHKSGKTLPLQGYMSFLKYFRLS